SRAAEKTCVQSVPSVHSMRNSKRWPTRGRTSTRRISARGSLHEDVRRSCVIEGLTHGTTGSCPCVRRPSLERVESKLGSDGEWQLLRPAITCGILLLRRTLADNRIQDIGRLRRNLTAGSGTTQIPQFAAPGAPFSRR